MTICCIYSVYVLLPRLVIVLPPAAYAVKRLLRFSVVLSAVEKDGCLVCPPVLIICIYWWSIRTLAAWLPTSSCTTCLSIIDFISSHLRLNYFSSRQKVFALHPGQPAPLPEGSSFPTLQTRVFTLINTLIPFFPVHCTYLIILFGANCRHFCYALNDVLTL